MRTNKPTPQEEQLLLDEHNCSIAYAVTAGIIMILVMAVVFGSIVIVNI